MSNLDLNVRNTYPPPDRQSGCRGFRSLFAATVFSLGAVLTLGLMPAPANAATVTFNLDSEFSGGDDPAGGTPWVTATFADIAGGVRMTIDTLGLVGEEFLTEFYFNIDPFLTPTNTNYVSGVTASAFDYGLDAFHADGDGFFDAQFDYPVSGAGIFGALMTSVYDLLHADLSVSNIIALSLGAGNSPDGLYVAAKIQGIGPDGEGSGWITGGPSVVPLPPALLLFLTGLAGIAFLSRRQRKPNGTAAA
jgi:hypothetical protein